jgi:hypothetical protein
MPSRIRVTLNDNYTSVVSSVFLVDHSEYFFRCLAGNWQEGSKGDVVLDFNMASWRIFQHWIETGIASSQPPKSPRIALHESPDALFDMTRKTEHSISECMASIERLTNAWVLGEYLVAPRFQNDVIDELTCAYGNFWHYKNDIPWPQILYACKNTLPNSAMHKVMLDLILFVTSIRSIDKDSRRLVEECGFTGAVGLMNTHPPLGNGVRRPAPWNRTRTFYHVKPREQHNVPVSWYHRYRAAS